MGKNRNHHYVPQFYLRNFSRSGPGGNDIGVVTLRSLAFIPRSSIKGQCYRVGYHDFHQEAEERIGRIEGLAAPLVRRLISDDTEHIINSVDRKLLYFFAALQYARNVSFSDNHVLFLGNAIKSATALLAPPTEHNMEDYDLELTHPTLFSFAALANSRHLLLDLDMQILINKTSENFVTSDNPVVICNEFSRDVTWKSVRGWKCSGIQIFLPLSPKHCLMLYDSDIYKVAGDRHHSRTYKVAGDRHHSQTTMSNLRDVKILNDIQIQNATSNIYVNDCRAGLTTQKRASQLAEARDRKSSLQFIRQHDDTGRPISLTSVGFDRLPSIFRPLSFMKIRKKFRKLSVRDRAGMYRY